MNLIELHILQSFPVTCLNRDDLGAPKSAFFGGVQRARVSSQCWKRPARELAHELMPSVFGASRSKILGPAIEKAARELGADNILTNQVTTIALTALGKDSNREGWVKTLFFFSPASMKNAVRKLVESKEKTKFATIIDNLTSSDKKKVDNATKEVKKIASGFMAAFGDSVTDAADIALFGRMVADDPSQTVEGAAMFSHALSTHTVRSELDFFSAVDDEKKASDNADDSGAGQLGDVEYNSACYYRYIGINLDLLDPTKKNNNCNLFDQTQKKVVLETFIRAAIQANPQARKNSMAGSSLPSYVLAVKRDGQPLSLANAFEKPIEAKRGSGFVEPSIVALEEEWNMMEETFGVKADVLCKLDPKKIGKIEKIVGVPLEELIKSLIADIV